MTPSLAVDAEGQMARFVTKTLRMCSGLVVLYLGTEAVVAVTGYTDLRLKNTYISFLEPQVVSGAVSLPRFR